MYLFDLLRIVVQQRLISPVRPAIGVGAVVDVHRAVADVVVSEVVSTHFAVDLVVVVGVSVQVGVGVLLHVLHVDLFFHQAVVGLVVVSQVDTFFHQTQPLGRDHGGALGGRRLHCNGHGWDRGGHGPLLDHLGDGGRGLGFGILLDGALLFIDVNVHGADIHGRRATVGAGLGAVGGFDWSRLGPIDNDLGGSGSAGSGRSGRTPGPGSAVQWRLGLGRNGRSS